MSTPIHIDGAAIRAFRAEYDLSQEQLARLLDVPASRVCRWEQGRHPVDALLARALRDLARELGAEEPR